MNKRGNLSHKPFKRFFSEKEKEERREASNLHWEVVAAARELAKFFNESDGRVDKSTSEYQEKFDRLSQALSRQNPEQKKDTVRFVQRKIVAGEIELGTLFYLEPRYVPTTRAFRDAFQLFSEREHVDYDIRANVNPVNGQAMLRALDAKSSDPRFLKHYMQLKKFLGGMGWLEYKPKSEPKSEPKTPTEPEKSAEAIKQVEESEAYPKHEVKIAEVPESEPESTPEKTEEKPEGEKKNKTTKTKKKDEADIKAAKGKKQTLAKDKKKAAKEEIEDSEGEAANLLPKSEKKEETGKVKLDSEPLTQKLNIPDVVAKTIKK